jgi:hypothetical protein
MNRSVAFVIRQACSSAGQHGIGFGRKHQWRLVVIFTPL